MKFNINNYKGKYAMHCKTQEEAKDFCNYMHSIGKRWNNVVSYLDKTEWPLYQTESVYLFNSDLVSNINFAERNNYTILEWSDFMNKKFTKADLKTGDVVKFRNEELGIIILEYDTIACKNGGWISMNGISEDLTSSFYIGKYDIVAVRRPNENAACCFDAMRANSPRGTLVYERKEPEEMTLAEVCKLLGKEIKIVK